MTNSKVIKANPKAIGIVFNTVSRLGELLGKELKILNKVEVGEFQDIDYHVYTVFTCDDENDRLLIFYFSIDNPEKLEYIDWYVNAEDNPENPVLLSVNYNFDDSLADDIKIMMENNEIAEFNNGILLNKQFTTEISDSIMDVAEKAQLIKELTMQGRDEEVMALLNSDD